MRRTLLLLCLLTAAPLPIAAPAAHGDAAAPAEPPLDFVLRERINALQARFAAGETPANPANAALLRFKLAQATLWLAQVDAAAGAQQLAARANLSATLDRAAAIGRALGDAADPPTPGAQERAYIAADGTVQPYWVFLPHNYDARRKYSLVVFLHGYDPAISKINPWVPGPETTDLATRRGVVLAIPYGRRNSDFVNIGEDDTLAVTAEVQRHYSIDPTRRILLGASMGGYGVYAVGLHHPELWAGIAAMCGRTDTYLWLKLDRAAVPPWKRLLYDADDPRFLEANALHVPIFMQHGALDALVSVEHSRRFYRDLAGLNYAVRYREITDGDHNFYWQASAFEVAFDWMTFVQQGPAPRRVVYSTGSLRDNRAYWVQIDGFADYNAGASIDARIAPDNTIEVTQHNVSAFTLKPPETLLQPGVPIVLRVNGTVAPQHFDPAQPVHWEQASDLAKSGSSGIDAPVKTALVCGPIKESYRDPFLLVYGTLGVPDSEAGPDEAAARRFADEWDLYADGLPPIKADRDVTPSDRANYNLVLFGTRASNLLLAQIADKLPLELTPGGYRLGNRQIAGSGLGLQFCYPSPFDARRTIVVQSGLYYGNALPINHKADLLPDYIVYNATIDPTDGTNQSLEAGYFDGQWKLPNDGR